MGSPSSRLDTPEHLRPWVDAGLKYAFQPGGVSSAASVQQAVQPQNFQQQAPQQPRQPQQGQGMQNQPMQSPQPQSAPPKRPAPQQAAQAQSTQQQTQVQPQADRPAPNFPLPWSKFFSMAPPTPKVVWTYMELGLDLDGQSDPKRAAVLRNLIGHHLKWPKGTAAFWPVAALNNGTLQPNAQFFWKGWEQWHTPHIACFGEEALRIIYPECVPGNTTYLLEHVTIHVLPPLAQLVTMLPHEQQLSIELLTSIRI